MSEEERLRRALDSIYELLGVRSESDAGAEIARLHEATQWRPIDTAPLKQRVLVVGPTLRVPMIAMRDPCRHHSGPLPTDNPDAYWYLETTRGTGSMWPAPTLWMPLPALAPNPAQDDRVVIGTVNKGLNP